MTEKSFKIQSIKPAYTGFFELNILHFKHLRYQGGWSNTFSRELFQRGQAVVVLLYDSSEEQVILVEQCRVGAVLMHKLHKIKRKLGYWNLLQG